MARAVAIKQSIRRGLEGTLDEPSIPSPKDWASWGPCLLHRTFHDRQVPCYTNALQFSTSGPNFLPREEYWAAVERAILDDFKRTGEL